MVSGNAPPFHYERKPSLWGILTWERQMASLRQMRGKWYARVQYRKNGKAKEKLIPLRTSEKKPAIRRKLEVEKYEKDIKSGLTFDFPWLNDEGLTSLKERTIDETVKDYYSTRRIEGIKESTIGRVEVAMKSLYKLINPNAALDSIDNDLIDRYKQYCRGLLNHRPNTININLSKIRAFLNWCKRKGYIDEVPYFEILLVPKGDVDYLSDEMFMLILNCDGIEFHFKRSFIFYRETGCRLFEPFIGMIIGNTLVIPSDSSKTHRKRTVVLNDLTKPILEEMRHNVSKCKGDQKYAIKNYSRVFKKICKHIQLPDNYHFHNLRDTYAVRRWAITGDIHLVREEIGHSSVTTTEKYADFQLETLLADFPSLEKWISPRLEKPLFDESFLMEVNPQILALKDTNLKDTIVSGSS